MKIKKVYDNLRETITTLDILESRINQIMNDSKVTGTDHIKELEREEKDFFASVLSLHKAIDLFLRY